MFKRNRLIAAATIAGALATAGPIATAGAAGVPASATVAVSNSSIPCYPFPAWCGSNGQPVPFAPWWVRPALGLPPSNVWPFNIVPVSFLPRTS
jgi:hypothetical protein